MTAPVPPSPLRREVEPPRRQSSAWVPVTMLGTTAILTIAMAMAVATPPAPQPSRGPSPTVVTPAASPSPAAVPDAPITAAERERLVRQADELIRASRLDIARYEEWARENLEEVHVPCHPGQAASLDRAPRAFEECVVMRRKHRP